MAINIMLNIDDLTVKGESKKEKYENWIEVLSWSWGMNQSGTTHMGSGSGGGKVSVHDISFTKYVDIGSSPLMTQCATGKHYKKAELHVLKADGDKSIPYFKFLLKDIIITSYSTGASGDSDRLIESLSLNFAIFEIKYELQESGTGRSLGSSGMGFDIAKNVEVK